MSKDARVRTPEATPATWRLAYELLGGRPVLGEPIRDGVDARQRASRELPIRALMNLLDGKHRQVQASLLTIVGISEHCYQQRAAAAERDSALTLSAEESCRLWEYAELHALATQTLGNHEKADRWLDAPPRSA